MSDGNKQRQQYAPPSLDLRLRRAQEEDLLDQEIWLLAQSEAYASRNAAWFSAAMSKSKPEIVSDYLRDHPPMARFVAEHQAAGTCGKAVEVIEAERAQRRAGPPAEETAENENIPASPVQERHSVSQSAMLTFVSAYISDCRLRDVSPNQAGCEKAWRDAGHGASGRDELRRLFAEQAGGPRPPGRPPKLARGNSQK